MRIVLPDAAATERAGARLAAALAGLPGPTVIALRGPLGAGKTTLARGLLRGLGHAGRVRSPTFTLLEPYDLADIQVAHLDLYRLSDPSELDFLGLADLLVPGAAVVVEWPERAGDRLPAPDLTLALNYDGAGRCLEAEAGTDAGRALAGALRSACQ
ncbi:MAG: tRNA (adenosine(37)-N6)-threonylcarbamoyltransferase complex ATPase subunit type 1 TsaE [Gammaproteobacteria bacterium]